MAPRYRGDYLGVKFSIILTLTHPIGLPPHAPVVQKIADKRWLIANSAKIGTFFI